MLLLLFISLLYAKAHGSYSAISGGEIAEALLDINGMLMLAIVTAC